MPCTVHKIYEDFVYINCTSVYSRNPHYIKNSMGQDFRTDSPASLAILESSSMHRKTKRLLNNSQLSRPLTWASTVSSVSKPPSSSRRLVLNHEQRKYLSIGCENSHKNLYHGISLHCAFNLNLVTVFDVITAPTQAEQNQIVDPLAY